MTQLFGNRHLPTAVTARFARIFVSRGHGLEGALANRRRALKQLAFLHPGLRNHDGALREDGARLGRRHGNRMTRGTAGKLNVGYRDRIRDLTVAHLGHLTCAERRVPRAHGLDHHAVKAGSFRYFETIVGLEK